MSEKNKKTKAEVESELEETTKQLEQVSLGYNNLLTANNNLTLLCQKYEETINILTARLLESRAQP
jgi:hypothetical protein